MQAASAALTTYLVKAKLDMPESYLAILSAVYIVQPSVGGTLGAVGNRVIATLVGSAIGLVCLVLLPDTLGTPVALVSLLLVINGAAALKPAWQYGVVAAIALSLGAENDALTTAIDRGIAIVLGAVIGITASLIVWPESAARRFERHLSGAILAVAARLDRTIDNAEGDGAHPDKKADADYWDSIQNAEEAADAIKGSRRQRYHDRLQAVRLLYNSVIILDRAVADTSDVPIDDRAPFRDQIDTVRKTGKAVLDSLLDDDTAQDHHLKRIDDALSEARQIMAEDTPDDSVHLLRATLLFGLKEFRAKLAKLIEASQGAATRSISETAKGAMPQATRRS